MSPKRYFSQVYTMPRYKSRQYRETAEYRLEKKISNIFKKIFHIKDK